MKNAEHRALRTEDRGLRHPRLRHRPGIESCDGGLDCRDQVEIEAPRLVHADTFVEIPEDALFAWRRDQRPCDDCPANPSPQVVWSRARQASCTGSPSAAIVAMAAHLRFGSCSSRSS